MTNEDTTIVRHNASIGRLHIEYRVDDGAPHSLGLHLSGDQRDEDTGSIRMNAVELAGLLAFLERRAK